MWKNERPALDSLLQLAKVPDDDDSFVFIAPVAQQLRYCLVHQEVAAGIVKV